MKMNNLVENTTRTMHKVGFKLKKHSPEILVVTGVIGTVVSAVMACKATTKLSEVMDNAKGELEAIHECAENPEYAEQYTPEDAKKDTAIVYAQTGLKLVKLYGPSVVVGAASITGILSGHTILRKRNLALVAAYTAEHLGFKEYRGRVIERFGEALDHELKYNIKAEEIEKTVTTKSGKEKTVKEVVEVHGPVQHSVYAKCFDASCYDWQNDSELNMFFLQQQQNYLNDKLKRQGYLFLNDAYKALGFDATKAGQVVGWIYDEKQPMGDNYVDFGIFNINSEAARRFVNGLEKNIWLDFNVDGNILDMI